MYRPSRRAELSEKPGKRVFDLLSKEERGVQCLCQSDQVPEELATVYEGRAVRHGSIR